MVEETNKNIGSRKLDSIYKNLFDTDYYEKFYYNGQLDPETTFCLRNFHNFFSSLREYIKICSLHIVLMCIFELFILLERKGTVLEIGSGSVPIYVL